MCLYLYYMTRVCNKYNWEEIQNFYNNNGTWRSMCKKFGCNSYDITVAKNLGLLKTRNKKEAYKIREMVCNTNKGKTFSYRKHRSCKYDWFEIQKYYNDDKTWRDIKEKFGVSDGAIFKAIKRGDLKLRNKTEAANLHFKKFGGRKHTEETKQKLSKIRIKYLTENPDKVPYLINHSSKKSWPEQIFETALISSGITGWVYKYQNWIYQYDFAFVDKKIDVEIDGGTHELDKVKKIDKRRDKFSIENGWRVVRFTAKEVKKDLIGCINRLKEILSN